MTTIDMSTKNSLKGWFKVGAVGNYFLRLFGKKDKSAPNSINLKLMHGINRITVFVFLLALLFYISKKLFF